MHLHEYQAKTLLMKKGVPIPPFAVAASDEEVERIIDRFDLKEAIIKVQIHAGGRGKSGGIKIGRSRKEIIEKARELIGIKIVNSQTGAEGVISRLVLITPLIEIEKEYYLGAVLDQQRGAAVLIASSEGGMEIEEIASRSPEKILKIPIGLDGTIRSFHLLYLAKFMGWKGKLREEGIKIASAVANAFISNDASLIEINPLVVSRNQSFWALDAKISVDENAIYRHPEIEKMYDASQLSSQERIAREHDLSYVALDGNIGCIVNGAGLAMATMDLISHAGGKPANFLDVGGSATAEKIKEGCLLLARDPHVRVILVNIFGGIMSCATIAEGIVAAMSSSSLPLIIRMEGTEVEAGKQLLNQSPLNFKIASSLEEAALLAVKEIDGNFD